MRTVKFLTSEGKQLRKASKMLLRFSQVLKVKILQACNNQNP